MELIGGWIVDALVGVTVDYIIEKTADFLYGAKKPPQSQKLPGGLALPSELAARGIITREGFAEHTDNTVSLASWEAALRVADTRAISARETAGYRKRRARIRVGRGVDGFNIVTA